MDEIRELLKEDNVVALTGAGISAESGIPTFRGSGGIWEKYNPSIFANPAGLIGVFLFHPLKIKQFLLDVFETIIEASPNKAHFILAQMERDGILNSIITQNIDNLHQEAGSKNVIELHGNVFRFRCRECGKKFTLPEDEYREFTEKVKVASRTELIKLVMPDCECGGRYRPDVVLFREALPSEEVEKAYNEINRAKTLLLIGTSGVVYPAASLPLHAKNQGVRIVEINSEITNLSRTADFIIREKATSGMDLIYRT